MSTAKPAGEVVALDLGGVIVDVDHERCARRLGLAWSACEPAFFADGMHDRLTMGTLDGAAFIDAAAAKLSLASALVREAWADVVAVLPEGRVLVEELLAAGARVHLWTNTDPIHLERMLAELPAGVVASTASFRLGAMKPQPAFFERARALGEPAIFLDDRLDVVDAARSAGVRATRCLGPVAARAFLVEAWLLRRAHL